MKMIFLLYLFEANRSASFIIALILSIESIKFNKFDQITFIELFFVQMHFINQFNKFKIFQYSKTIFF